MSMEALLGITLWNILIKNCWLGGYCCTDVVGNVLALAAVGDTADVVSGNLPMNQNYN